MVFPLTSNALGWAGPQVEELQQIIVKLEPLAYKGEPLRRVGPPVTGCAGARVTLHAHRRPKTRAPPFERHACQAASFLGLLVWPWGRPRQAS